MLQVLLRSSIWHFLIIVFFHFTTAERYRCSVSEEKCVFPFDDDGVTYNECASGVYRTWCKTNGSYGWAYCEVCEEDKTTTTSTVSTTTSTTNQPTTTTSTTSTTDPPATTTKTTHSTTVNKTDPPATTTKTTHPTSTPPSTTSTPKTTTSTSSPTTTSTADATSLEDDGATVDSLIKQPVELDALEEDEDEFLDSTTNSQEKDLDDGVTELANAVEEPISPEKIEASTTIPVSTTEPTTAKVCTHSGKHCQFPFEYSGKMYYSCFETIAYSWCYTDASIEEYTYCMQCTETSTSTTSTSTRTSTTTSTNVMSASSTKQPITPARKASTSTTSTSTRTSTTTSTNVLSASSTKQPITPARKVSKKSRIVKVAATVSTSSQAVNGGTVVPPSSPATTSHGLLKPAETNQLPFNNEGNLVKTEAATQEVPALKQNGIQGTASRVLSGQDTSGETSNTKTVVIIVAVLSCLAILVTIALVSLYIRKRRRNSRKDGVEKNGNVGESGEVLLSQNMNGNHKSTNDGSSQEMQPLNSKPREENGAGGDCDVINEKADETTPNVTV